MTPTESLAEKAGMTQKDLKFYLRATKGKPKARKQFIDELKQIAKGKEVNAKRARLAARRSPKKTAFILRRLARIKMSQAVKAQGVAREALRAEASGLRDQASKLDGNWG